MGGYDRAKLEAEIERDEDLRLRWYWDTATPRCRTIGIGRNLDARRPCGDGTFAIGITPTETAKLGVTRDSCIAAGISRLVALALFANDIGGSEKDLDRALPWWRTLSDTRQRVLLNMCFNMGIQKLMGFKKMIAALFAARWNDAADEMADSSWAGQVGARATRLAAMMRAG